MDVKFHPLVPAAEAARITYSGFRTGTFIELGQYYGQIQSALLEGGVNPNTWGSLWGPMILTIIWNAGRIQGIRSERARCRKQTSKPPEDPLLREIVDLCSRATPHQCKNVHTFVTSYLRT